MAAYYRYCERVYAHKGGRLKPKWKRNTREVWKCTNREYGITPLAKVKKKR